ncbi:hypothetical protein AALB53_05290 [Lachnospiraceae bacterium 47-T17]
MDFNKLIKEDQLWQPFRGTGKTEQSGLEAGGDAFDTSILDQLDGTLGGVDF